MEKHVLQWTGERFLPWLSNIQPDIALEHLSRYFIARTFCAGKDVLDVASGEGYGSRILSDAAANVLGVDIAEEAVSNAKERYQSDHLKFAVQDAVHLEQLGQKFDVVTAFEMIEHIRDQEQFIIQVKKVLKEYGIFMVSTPNKYVHENEWHTKNEFHVKELYFKEFQALLENNFRHCYFYAQRVYRASESWRLESGSSGTVHQDLVRIDADGAVEIKDTDKSPGYFFCFCSDQPIEDLNEKYYLTDVSDRLKSNLEEEIQILRNPEFHYMNQYTIYYDYGNGFSEQEKDSFEFRYTEDFDKIQMRIILPEHVRQIRLDPVEQRFCILRYLNITGCSKERISSNHSREFDGMLVFENQKDPQIVIHTEGMKQQEIFISYEILVYESAGLWGILNEKRLDREKLEKERAKSELLRAELNRQEREKQKLLEYNTKIKLEKQELVAREMNLRKDISGLLQDISDIHASTSWKISRPVRAAGMLGRWLTGHFRPVHKCNTAVKILKNGGIRLLVHEIKHYKEYKMQVPADRDPRSMDLSVDSEYQENQDFSKQAADVKMLAFYLPQFHVFPENEQWWGKGFTEWTNVRSGEAAFDGHDQPRVPHPDFGYYDLTDIHVLKKQAKLASQHGIYGFCFYYYWFSGKRLMEKPLELLSDHPEIDLKYCLCWANENWTRAWDGQDRDILIAQKYSDEDDRNFILDLKKYLEDKRYIRIYGKPLILVYNPGQIPDCHKSFQTWRKTAQKTGIGEILIWTCQTANHTAEELHIEDCIDAEVEFPPHNMWWTSAAVRGADLGGRSAFLYSYPKIADKAIDRLKAERDRKIPLHHGCMLAWDNAARRKEGWFTYCSFSLKSLYRWVRAVAGDAREKFEPEERFVFINAWNEWGEGTYLEPDEKYGYSGINTVSKALLGLPWKNDLKIVHQGDAALEKEDFEQADMVRIAVQIHMFYLDTLDEVISCLNQIPYSFDCYISTNTSEKKRRIEKRMQDACQCHSFCVEIYENRGRDVAPFLVQMKERLCQYDYICHIHSKKTKTDDHGNEWRKYNYRHLFGSSGYLKRVFQLFESDSNLGILMPETYPVLELQAEWGGNREGVMSVLHKMGIQTPLPKEPVFPVGNMFWARTDAVRKMFEYGLTQKDFPAEAGQNNATIAHQIERIWVYLAVSQGYSYQKIFNNCQMKEGQLQKKRRLLSYVHYDKENIISDDDLKTLQIFSGICEKVLFVTNSVLKKDQLDRVAEYADHILLRENRGFDFGAWKDSMYDFGKDQIRQFDELILLNNSCFPPVFDIQEMFAEMEGQNLDFWGNTISPFSPDGSYIGEACMDEHIQSYFMVFQERVLASDRFWKFWEELPECQELIDVIAKCETKLTKILKDAGFSCAPYIRETYYMSRFLNNYAIPYEKPCSLLLLKDAFVKKKCYQYMEEEEKVRLEFLMKNLY